MKILIIGNGSIGNFQNREFYINNHTGSFLHNVSIQHEMVFVQRYSQYEPNNDLQNYELIANKISFRGLKSIKNPFQLLQLLYLISINDIVYLFYPGTLSRISALISIVLMKKYGLYVRGQFYNQNYFDKIILKKSDFILTITPSFQKALTKYCSKVDVIKPMISILKEDIIYSREYNIPNKWNFLFVGRVEFSKGIFDLIEIAEYLKKLDVNFEINIIGGGDLYDTINKLVVSLGMSDSIKLHGQVSNKKILMAEYNKADAFIFTSHNEGFPRVLYEAMATGLPIFTTFVGGISGIMRDGENCVEIPVKKGKESAKIIFEVLNNINLLKKIGINGRETILEILDGKYSSHEHLLTKNIYI